MKIYAFTIVAAALLSVLLFWGCIKDDDGTPAQRDLPTITMTNLTVTEDDVDRSVAFELVLSGNHTTNAVVKYALLPGTATTPLDYFVAASSQLVFAPGETRKVIEITVVGDEVKEPTETFTLQLYNPVNVNLAAETATITINDDDDNTAGLEIPTTGYTTPNIYPGYSLVWADEFDGTALNTDFWTYETGTGNNGWGNNELQYYREDNTTVQDGFLIITAKQQKIGTSDYTSSRLVTKGKKAFKFGRIDIRAALPKGKGMWPALWMLGSNIDAVSWPACGEIDIMELTGDLPNRVLGTVHFGANTSQHQYITQAKYLAGTDTYQEEFHVFSINWVADKIEFLVDDELFHTITPANMNGAAYPFNKPFFFIFNVAVGGNLPGAPDATTPFPQSMIVDYVRVFQ
jgi:hypothetical protein